MSHPKVTIETLEAVRLFLFTKSTAFVIAADEAMIEYSVRSYFPDFPAGSEKSTGYQYSQRYLEKLIQVPFRIPVLGKVESEMYTTLLLIGSCVCEDDPNFIKALDIAREKMKTPWKNQGFTIEEIQKVFGDSFPSIAESFSIANQISDILSKNTQGNPRKIKRFINMLLLRKEIAEARGFGSYIQLPIMAKMMLAEQFYADEYKTIAGLLDEDGKCEQLGKYEKNLSATETANSDTNVSLEDNAVEKGAVTPISKEKDDEQILKWKTLPDFPSWVLCKPLLGEVDLRPYFFASKGTEDYFFEQTQNEVLRQLISKLMGGRMAATSAEEEIKALNARDAKYVFEILSHKILQAGSLLEQPKGIEGIRKLVECHETLEENLMQLIRAMDYSKVGMWIFTGWEKCIRKDECKKSLQNYYEMLAEKGPTLIKSAAKKKIETKEA